MKHLALALALSAAIPSASLAQGPVAVRPAASPLAAAVRLADWQLGQMHGGTVSRATGETRNPRACEVSVREITSG